MWASLQINAMWRLIIRSSWLLQKSFPVYLLSITRKTTITGSSEGLMLNIHVVCMCVRVHLCENNYIDGMHCVCNVSFHLELRFTTDVVHLLLGISLHDWENIKQSRTHLYAVKGKRFFRTCVHRHAHIHALSKVTITAHKCPPILTRQSIHAEIHKGLTEQSAGDSFTCPSQTCDNCFEMKYLLYCNAN